MIAAAVAAPIATAVTGTGLDFAVLKEYGLAGVLAYLFWWTLRRMMASHDATLKAYQEQVQAQDTAIKEISSRFSAVMENHVTKLTECVTQQGDRLNQHMSEDKGWKEKASGILDCIAQKLTRAAGGQ